MPAITCNLAHTVNQMVVPGKDYGTIHLTASITDDNPALNTVGATLDWNDGSPPVQITPGQKPIAIDETRELRLGTYYVTLLAYNYQVPIPGLATYYVTIVIQPEQLVPTTDSYLFGPILPMDDEFPNETEWNFDTGINLAVLKSSVKMLLITSKGERIMNPTYGTNLRRVVFEPNSGNVIGIVQQEIDEAINQFEPRVTLESLDVIREGARAVVVNARFLSRMNQTTFNLTLPFTQS